jgi:DNA-binding transcriptional ArsR family regulator
MMVVMEETLLIRSLGNSPTLRIVDFFLDNRLFDYAKNEILGNIEMGRATFFKQWKELEQLGIVKVTRKIGKANLYMLNEKNEIVQKIIELDSALCKKAMEKALLKEPTKQMVTA